MFDLVLVGDRVQNLVLSVLHVLSSTSTIRVSVSRIDTLRGCVSRSVPVDEMDRDRVIPYFCLGQ